MFRKVLLYFLYLSTITVGITAWGSAYWQKGNQSFNRPERVELKQDDKKETNEAEDCQTEPFILQNPGKIFFFIQLPLDLASVSLLMYFKNPISNWCFNDDRTAIKDGNQGTVLFLFFIIYYLFHLFYSVIIVFISSLTSGQNFSQLFSKFMDIQNYDLDHIYEDEDGYYLAASWFFIITIFLGFLCPCLFVVIVDACRKYLS